MKQKTQRESQDRVKRPLDEFDDLMNAWKLILQTYGAQIQLAHVYAEASVDLGLTAMDVIMGLRRWVQTGSNRQAPTPYDLYVLVTGRKRLSSREIASLFVKKVTTMVKKMGWAWRDGVFEKGGQYWLDDRGNKHSSFEGALVATFGAVGKIFKDEWVTICETWSESNTAQIAQMRDYVEATLNGMDEEDRETVALAVGNSSPISLGTLQQIDAPKQIDGG